MNLEYLRLYGEVAKRNFPLGKYNPFPYGGVNTCREVFRGEDNGYIRFGNVLGGYMKTMDKDFVIKRHDTSLTFSGGTQFLELHFQQRRVNVYKGELGAVLSVLTEATKDMMSVSRRLVSDPRFVDIELMGGNTNMTLARLAVDKLGFSFVNPSDAQRISGNVPIYMTRGRLLSQEQDLVVISERLANYRMKRLSRHR